MLISFWMTQRLTREIHQLERQAIEKRTRLMHYQKYADRLGGSTTMSMANIAGLSCELLPRATLFAQYSEQASSMSAMQNVQMYKMMGLVPNTGNPYTQMQLEMSAYARFKEQSLKALKQQEVDAMSEVEKELQLEMNTIDTRIKEKRAMLESCKKLLDEQVRDSAPKFGLG